MQVINLTTILHLFVFALGTFLLLTKGLVNYLTNYTREIKSLLACRFSAKVW
jgi:hypothetical protein